MAATRQARLARMVRLIRPPEPNTPGVLQVREGRESTFYTFVEIPCEIGGRGFALHRLGVGTLYHVRVGAAEDCSCECLGFLRWGYCKHVLGLLALIEAGQLDKSPLLDTETT